MGTDIHVVIQRQESGGGWLEVVYQREPYTFEKDQTNIAGIPVAPTGFDDRNYDLFAILGNVRNGHGFAGVEICSGWPFISDCRGLPVDITEDTVAPNPRYPEDGPRSIGYHSFTWVSLDELKSFDWDGTMTMQTGCVAAKDYEALGPGETPQKYCGGVNGPHVHIYQPDDYREKKSASALVAQPYVRMRWPESARVATSDWPGRVIPWLEELADGRPLRLVIGFDS